MKMFAWVVLFGLSPVLVLLGQEDKKVLGFPEDRKMFVVLDTKPIIKSLSLNEKYLRDFRDGVKKNLAIMPNLIARQYVQSGIAGHKPAMHFVHEVRLVTDLQIFREVGKDGIESKKEESIPCVKGNGIVPVAEWYGLFEDIASLPLEYLGESTYQTKPVHIFSIVSDQGKCNMCIFSEFLDGCGGKRRVVFGRIAGTILADADLNIISVWFVALPVTEARLNKVTMTYVGYKMVTIGRWGPTILLPATVRMIARFQDGRRFYADGTWDRYRLYDVKAKMFFPEVGSSIRYNGIVQ